MREPCQRIFLIGYRGTGKTTTAGVLAKRLGWDCCDADVLLEQRHERTIRQIFAEEGEAGFRAREAALLVQLAALPRHVIATGGGIVLSAANRQRLREAGFVVWLTADTDTIWRRMQMDPKTGDRRPNLAGGGRAEVEELLRQREPLYAECAACTVDTTSRTPDEVAEIIANSWGRG